MPARSYIAADPFTRGLVLARLWHEGHRITTTLVRSRLGVSRATAKRDLRAMRRQGFTLPIKQEPLAP